MIIKLFIIYYCSIIKLLPNKFAICLRYNECIFFFLSFVFISNKLLKLFIGVLTKHNKILFLSIPSTPFIYDESLMISSINEYLHNSLAIRARYFRTRPSNISAPGKIKILPPPSPQKIVYHILRKSTQFLITDVNV